MDPEDILLKSAIDPAWAAEVLGVRIARTIEDVPEWAKWIVRNDPATLPMLVFPQRRRDGSVSTQIRPAVPVVIDDRLCKYLNEPGSGSVLSVLIPRPDAKRIALTEGTRQAAAMARYAPTDTEVIGINGCTAWSHDGVPSPDLAVVAGKAVTVMFDVDMSTNFDVWTAARQLADVCTTFGATEVRFSTIGGYGTTGIDDFLGGLPEDQRAAVAKNALDQAKPTMPRKPAKKVKSVDWDALGRRGRPVLDVHSDRLALAKRIVLEIGRRWGGTRLFKFGDVTTYINEHDTPVPVGPQLLIELANIATEPVARTQSGDVVPATYDSTTRDIVVSRSERQLVNLDRITHTPFLRDDGTVCTTGGYDRASGTLLLQSDDLDGVTVPDSPTDSEVQSAVKLLLDDWLVDMPFATPADRTNCLALVLTAFIRGTVGKVPLAVLDGLGPGVGKGLLVDIFSLLFTGEPASPTSLPPRGGYSDQEAEKIALSIFARGADIVMFDEAHDLGGTTLARMITASNYGGRVLGLTKYASFPNRSTWIAVGNNVKVRDDMVRRCYRIALHPEQDHWENKSDFRHPNLTRWTRDHRAELMSAALTIVRSWHANGRPEAELSFGFGSFEDWQADMAGILANAGVTGFLENLDEWRNDVDPGSALLLVHVAGLLRVFPNKKGGEIAAGPFTVSDARQQVVAGALEDPIEDDVDPRVANSWKKYGALLGLLYRKSGMKRFEIDGAVYRIAQVGHGGKANTVKWAIRVDPITTSASGSDEASGSRPARMETSNEISNLVSLSTRGGEEPLASHEPLADVAICVFDLETDGAEHLFEGDPGFIRLSMTAEGERLPNIAQPMAAHNGFGFDFQALAVHHGLDIIAAADADLLIDTMVLVALDDPPPADEKRTGPRRKWLSLDEASKRKGGPGKTHDIKKLAKQHGGFDQIPLDVLRPYCAGDVVAAQRLMRPLDDYARREMRVMGRLAGSITREGFRVDLPLLQDRIDAGQAIVDRVVHDLVTNHGMPTTTKAGKPSPKPFATAGGKAAIFEAFRGAGADPDKWPREMRTRAGVPSLGQESMQFLIDKAGTDWAEASTLAATVMQGNGVRTVYQTIAGNLTGDRVHPMIFPLQTSGRLSITDPGLTVLGKRGGRWHEREVMIADEGCLILAADFDQVDARCVAAHAQDPAYLALFAPGIDAHEEIAAMVWGIRDGKHGEYRNRAKVVTHGWSYGLGVPKLAAHAGILLADARLFDSTMRQRFPLLIQWKERVVSLGAAGLALDNGFGRMMKVNPERAYTQAPAHMGQGAARDVMMEAVLRLPQDVVRMLRAAVHDELVFSVPADRFDEVRTQVLDAMTFDWAPPGVKTAVQITASAMPGGPSWGSVYA